MFSRSSGTFTSVSELYPADQYWKSFTKTWHSKSYPKISPLQPDLQVKDSVVFITGGGTGIGRAAAIAFAQAGAKSIAIFGRRVEKLQSAAEEARKANPNGTTKVVFESVDLSERAAVESAFAEALEKVGETKIDIFLPNAGIQQPHGPVAGYDQDQFLNGLKLNVVGAFNTIQVMMPLLAPKAKVLHISSGIAHMYHMPGSWAYAATKIANTKMFEYLQDENPDLFIVNVQPGVVNTEINVGTPRDGFGVDDG